MFDPASLLAPIVGAPMAGGPSTPELTAAISDAGGFGILAGAYLSPAQLREQIAAVRSRTGAPFGVNLFVPEEIPFDAESFLRFRDELLPLAARFGATLPQNICYSDDAFEAKTQVLLDEGVHAVSFTFGVPAPEVFAACTARGIATITTVTDRLEAEIAVAAGTAVLCAQGVEAGGHRSTFHILDDDRETPVLELLGRTAGLGVPVIGAGGIGSVTDVQAMLDAGAVAAQVGTLFLRTPEAGTRAAHRAALADPRFTETRTTRAYSGRPARALVNDYVRRYSRTAPPVYPQINGLTGPLRQAAADDPQVINLWAGTGWRGAQAAPAAQVVAALTPPG
ncbi:putative 2-nitropropane dioxygenase [Gordonia hirsuta DSM 44140 = NBRC 16056]|uniref:Propionate 3-nitronate monooxygenase n=1 Tax=Gordonia hirsuta DSM 44140 = NBRC 16056 TaxID=1121927 RepID=L7L9M2_9ACTN|nr:nitronate monooxygenase [Gordonia hirsuta]GAC56747.1 putative 2-nitropropane dioxygenase [Gordonia hirsuta DSM 44140 = NBRC 16056]